MTDQCCIDGDCLISVMLMGTNYQVVLVHHMRTKLCSYGRFF